MTLVLLAAVLTLAAGGTPAAGTDAPAVVPGTSVRTDQTPDPEAAAAAVPESSRSAETQAIYEQGLRLYGARDFAAAIAAFAKAYAIEARSDILFAWAQAARLAGDCAGAVALFEKFLGSGPPEQQVDAARLAMKRCEAAAVPTVTVLPPLRRMIANDGLTAVKADTAPGRSWYRDTTGNVLLGAGMVAVVVGTGLIMAAHDHLDHAYDSFGAYGQARQTAQTRLNLGIGALVVGGAVVTAGIVRYVWMSIGDGGATATVGGRF